MREIEIKVSPIRIREQAREMEEDKEKRILGRSVPTFNKPKGKITESSFKLQRLA